MKFYTKYKRKLGLAAISIAIVLAGVLPTTLSDSGSKQSNIASRALSAVQTYTIQPNQTIPFLAPGDTVLFAGGVHSRTITTPTANVTYKCAIDSSIDASAYQVAFYVTKADITVDSCDIKGAKTGSARVLGGIYVSGGDRFKLLNSKIFDGGDDSAFDHGLYIDGSIGFLVENVTIYGWSANGTQVYSGSGRQTTGTFRNYTAYNNGRDGLVFGAGSKDVLATGLILYGNKGYGLQSYSGSGNRVDIANIWNNVGGQLYERVPLAQKTNIVFGPPAPPPPPPPDPEPTPICDATCIADYEQQISELVVENSLLSNTNTTLQTQITTLQAEIVALQSQLNAALLKISRAIAELE